MRVLLAVLVGLAQVAGPWLCCCGPARAAAAPPVETCPHCRPRSPEPPVPPLPEPCPCGGKVVDPGVPAKPDPVAAPDPAPPAPGFAAGRVAPASLPPVAGLSGLPFLPPGTRLFVHHVLRC